MTELGWRSWHAYRATSTQVDGYLFVITTLSDERCEFDFHTFKDDEVDDATMLQALHVWINGGVMVVSGPDGIVPIAVIPGAADLLEALTRLGIYHG